MARRHWSAQEVDVLVSRTDLTNAALADLLGRNLAQVKNKKAALRRGASLDRPGWTPEEDEVVIEWTGKRSASAIAEMLPGRTRSAVINRRMTLKLAPAPGGPAYSPTVIGRRPFIAKTCLKCGHLLPSEFFPRKRDTGLASSYCTPCGSDSWTKWKSKTPDSALYPRSAKSEDRNRTRTRVRKLDSLTRSHATRHNFPYLEDDHRVLSDPTLTQLGKALVLKRTYSAVRGQCSRSKYPSRGNAPALDRTEAAWSIHNPNAVRADEITAALKAEFVEAGVKFPVWDWDDEDLLA